MRARTRDKAGAFKRMVCTVAINAPSAEIAPYLLHRQVGLPAVCISEIVAGAH